MLIFQISTPDNFLPFTVYIYAKKIIFTLLAVDRTSISSSLLKNSNAVIFSNIDVLLSAYPSRCLTCFYVKINFLYNLELNLII